MDKFFQVIVFLKGCALYLFFKKVRVKPETLFFETRVKGIPTVVNGLHQYIICVVFPLFIK